MEAFKAKQEDKRAGGDRGPPCQMSLVGIISPFGSPPTRMA